MKDTLSAAFILLLAVLTFSLFIPSTTAALNDATVYYSFEDQPKTGVTDQTGNNADAVERFDLIGGGSTAYPTTDANTGYWAYFFVTQGGNDLLGDYNGSFISNDYNGSDGNITTNISISYWVRHSTEDTAVSYYAHFMVGDAIKAFWNRATGEYNIRIHDRDAGQYGQCRYDADNFTNLEWNHVAYTIDPTVGYSWCPTVYFNGIADGVDGGGGTGGTTINGDLSFVVLHNNTNIGVNDRAGTAIYFDEFGIWNRSLSTAEISELYSDGEGSDPYTAYPPILVNPIPDVTIPTEFVTDIIVGNYFRGESNISFNVTYASTDFGPIGFYETTNTLTSTGEWSIYMYEADTVAFYSFDQQINGFDVEFIAENDNGFTTDTMRFTVSGYGDPTILTSPGNLRIIEGQSETYYLNDYFDGYLNNFTYLWVTSPDDGLNDQINNNGTQSYSCFDIRLNNGAWTIDGKSPCNTDYQIYVCESLTECVNTDTAEIRIVDASTVQGSGLIGFFSDFLTLFPDGDNLNNTTKSLIVFIFLTIILVSAVLLVREGASASVVSYGVAIIGFFALIFFTAIGYIPIWLIITLIGIVAIFFIVKTRSAFGGM